MKRKVCVVITARPSYARIRTAMEAIRDHEGLELQLVVAASALLDRYGNAVSVIESEGFKIDRTVYMIVEGENLVTSAKSTGFGLAELATVFNDLKPDMVVTIADRYETIATSIAAAYMNIPLVHVQGGEVRARSMKRSGMPTPNWPIFISSPATTPASVSKKWGSNLRACS